LCEKAWGKFLRCRPACGSISWAYSSSGLAQAGRFSHSAPVLVSLSSRQLARLARKVATEAMTIELAAERGDWEAVHDADDRLIGHTLTVFDNSVERLGPPSQGRNLGADEHRGAAAEGR
jgi:hypothetical protein